MNSANNIVNSNRSDTYCCVIVCREIDRFQHNAVFADEISTAIESLGKRVKIIDYREKPQDLLRALRDSFCDFAISFNGFGSELLLSYGNGASYSVFQETRKPLYDLMHDQTSAEYMGHQTKSRGLWRNLLLTDWGYVAEAHELEIRNVCYVPSITFPKTLSLNTKPLVDRPIETLLPVGLTPLSTVRALHKGLAGARSRVYRMIFEEAVEACVADLYLDPRVEGRRLCREAGVHIDVNEADGRFLITSILDGVKFARRDKLLKSLSIPVTLVADRQIDLEEYGANISAVPARNFSDLLSLMTESRIVLCPLPHMTGFHERAMGAFSAEAAVLAAPNEVLRSNFRYDEEYLVYGSAEACGQVACQALKNLPHLQQIATSGHERARSLFSPVELARRILSMERLRCVQGREDPTGAIRW